MSFVEVWPALLGPGWAVDLLDGKFQRQCGGPKIVFGWFITTVTMVCGGQITIIGWDCKPASNVREPQPAKLDLWRRYISN